MPVRTISTRIQSFSDAPLKKCPKCGKLKLRRALPGSGPALIFKGSGFYQDRLPQRVVQERRQGRPGEQQVHPAETKTGTDGAAGKGAKDTGTNGAGAKESAKSTGKSAKSKT